MKAKLNTFFIFLVSLGLSNSVTINCSLRKIGKNVFQNWANSVIVLETSQYKTPDK